MKGLGTLGGISVCKKWLTGSTLRVLQVEEPFADSPFHFSQ